MDNLITHYKLTIKSTALKLGETSALGAVFFVCGIKIKTGIICVCKRRVPDVRGKRLASGTSPADGIGIAHPCAIPTLSLLRKLGYLQHFRPRVGAQASGTDSAARLGDEFALRQTSQISGFKFAIV